MLKIQFKILLKNKVRIILFLLLFISCFFLYSKDFDNKFVIIFKLKPDVIIWNTVQTAILFFIIILFISFSVFSELEKTKINEITITSDNYKNSGYAIQLLSIGIVVFIYYILRIIFSYISYMQSYNIDFEIQRYMFKIYGLYILVNGILAIIIGFVASRLPYRLTGLMLCAFMVYLYSPMISESVAVFSIAGIDIYKYFIPFIIFNNASNVNGFCMLPVNFSLLSRSLIWIFLFGSIGYILIKKYKTSLILFILAIASFIYAESPASYYSQNESANESDSLWYPMYYYADNPDNTIASKGPDIEKYKLEIRLGREMKVDADVYFSDVQATRNVCFTLFHVYKIDSIVDEAGNELDYVWENDHIIINLISDTKKLSFKYHGGSANFYSGREGVNLPGSFAYYPISGKFQLYDIEKKEWNNVQYDYNVEFDVSIKGNVHKMYSNLNEVADNHFTGMANSVTLMSNFLTSEVVDGITIIYPKYNWGYRVNEDYSRYNIDYYNETIKFIKNDGYINKIIFMEGSTSAGIGYIDNGCLVTGSGWRSLYITRLYNDEYLVDEYSVFKSFEEAEDSYRALYNELTRETNISYNYEMAYNDYCDGMKPYYYHEFGSEDITYEDFEKSFIKFMGEDELNKLKEGYYENR